MTDQTQVYVVYDPLHERVISVHKTKKGSNFRSSLEDVRSHRNEDPIYLHEVINCLLEE